VCIYHNCTRYTSIKNLNYKSAASKFTNFIYWRCTILIKLYAMLTFPNWWSGAQKCSLLPFATGKDIASECTKLLFYEKTEETRQGLQKHGCYCRRMNFGGALKWRHVVVLKQSECNTSPRCTYGVTCMSLKTRFMCSMVTEMSWSKCILWTTNRA